MTKQEALERLAAIFNEPDYITEAFVVSQRDRVRFTVMEALAELEPEIDWNMEAAHGEG